MIGTERVSVVTVNLYLLLSTTQITCSNDDQWMQHLNMKLLLDFHLKIYILST